MSKRSTTEQQAAGASSLVSRLVQAQHDPVKRRARQWLISIADQRLAEFGLSSKDIAVLRGAQVSIATDHRLLPGQMADSAARFEAASTASPDRTLSLNVDSPWTRAPVIGFTCNQTLVSVKPSRNEGSQVSAARAPSSACRNAKNAN
jgi:hypothetical protein